MSTIDSRIVQLQMQNQDFDRKALESAKALDGLDNSIKNISKGTSLDGLSSGVDLIASRFSNLGVVATTALQNITTAAMNAGSQMIKAVTVEPLVTGLAEYETKMNSISTILTNTASKGTTLDDVNRVLAEMNEYADLTIYNFAEMTRNIGTFTAAGVDLDIAAGAIKGIANLAAGVGSTSQQASTAMYQLSQALAEGRVSLQTWNSVVNAGMGGELLQRALVDQAVKLGELAPEIAENIKNGTIAFRQAIMQVPGQGAMLEISTQNLINTFNQMANDPALIEAATQVRTFTQMIDTMKESLQSGWAVSWEHIIGDKAQAAATLTAIKDGFDEIVGASADARNEMLGFWNENGGRQAIIDALASAFDNLKTVLAPIQEAFKQVFPPTTGQQLVDLSNKIKESIQGFKMDEQVATNLKNTFTGLFSVFKMVGQGIVSLAGTVAKLLSGLAPLAGYLLEAAASTGRFFTMLADNLDQSSLLASFVDMFSQVFKRIQEYFIGFDQVVGDTFTKLRESLEDFFSTKITPEALDSFGNSITRWIDNLPSFTELLKKASEALKEFRDWVGSFINFEKISAEFMKFVGTVQRIFGLLKNLVAEALSSIGINSLEDLINVGGLTVIIGSLKKFIDSVAEPFEGLAKVFKTVKTAVTDYTGILDGVRGSLEAYQSSLKAGTLMTIASAIAVLSGSLLLLSTVDSEKMTNAMAGITALFIELMAAMTIMKFVTTGKLGSISKSLFLLALAIGDLSKTVIRFGEVDMQTLARGLIATAIGLGELILVAKILDGTGVDMKTAALIASLVISIRMLTDAVMDMASLDFMGLVKGLGGVGILLLELSIFMNTTSFGETKLSSAFSVLMLAEALKQMATAVKMLADIDIVNLTMGLTAIGTLLIEIHLFITSMPDSSKMISMSVGIYVISKALQELAKVVQVLGGMDIVQLVEGLAGLGIVLAELALFLDSLKGGDILKNAIGLNALALALNGIAVALRIMGGMSLQEMSVGLTALSGSLLAIALALESMKDTLMGSAALTVAAAAILMFTPALIALAQLDIYGVGIALAALAGTFTTIGLAGKLLGPMAGTIVALSGSILGLGAAIALAGVGMTAFGVGLGIAVAAIGGLVMALGEAIRVVSQLVNDLPNIAQKFGQALIEIIKVLGEGAGEISVAFVKIIEAALKALVEATPKILEGIFQLIIAVLKVIGEQVPVLIAAITQLVDALVRGLIDNMGPLVQSALDLAIAFVNGIAQGIRDNTDAVLDALKNLLSSIIEFVLAALAELVGLIPVIGDTMKKGLLDARQSVQDVLAPQEMQKIGQAAGQGLTKGLSLEEKRAAAQSKKLARIVEDTMDEELDEGEKVGSKYSKQFVEGLGGQIPAASKVGSQYGDEFVQSFAKTDGKGSAKTVAQSLSTGLKSNEALMTTAGQSAGNAYVTGFTGKEGSMKSTAQTIAKNAATSMSNQKSSFNTAGSNTGQGFIDGLNSKISAASTAAANVAKAALEAMKKTLEQKSPSRATAEIGRFFDEGFVKGIEQNSRHVERATEDLSTKAINSLSAVINSISTFLNEGLDHSPIITPIIDTSLAKTQALELNKTLGSNSYNLASGAFRMFEKIQNDSIPYQGQIQQAVPPSTQFVQNNYSPKALNLMELYRQTNNQFSSLTSIRA